MIKYSTLPPFLSSRFSARVWGGEAGNEAIVQGTSKSAEGFAARKTFQRAKEEGMRIAVHWQDADSSSAKAVSEEFPDAEIMICSGHAGRAHKKILEVRQKIKKCSKQMLAKYGANYPAAVNARATTVLRMGA